MVPRCQVVYHLFIAVDQIVGKIIHLSTTCYLLREFSLHRQKSTDQSAGILEQCEFSKLWKQTFICLGMLLFVNCKIIIVNCKAVVVKCKAVKAVFVNCKAVIVNCKAVIVKCKAVKAVLC